VAVTIATADLSKGGAVVEDSSGNKYAVFVDSNVLVVYESIDGTPSLGDSDTAATVHGGGNIGWCHAAIDGNDDIHIICVCDAEQTRDVSYAVYDTGTSSLGAWAEATSYVDAAPTTPRCSVSFHTDGYLRVLYTQKVAYHGTNYDQVYFVKDTSTGWEGEYQISGTASDNYSSPSLTVRDNNYWETFCYNETDGDPCYRSYTGSWGAEATYTETSATIGRRGVVSTTGGTVYRYHADDAEDIEENDADTTYNTDTTNAIVSAALDGTTRYVFYIDTSDDVHVISNDGGGWTDEGAQQTGTYVRVVAEWAYLYENQSGEINYLFDDGTNVYYDAFDTGGAVTYSVTAAANAVLKEVYSETAAGLSVFKETSSVATPGQAFLQMVASATVALQASLKEVYSIIASGTAVLKEAVGQTVASQAFLQMAVSAMAPLQAVLKEIYGIAVNNYAVLRETVGAVVDVTAILKETASNTVVGRSVIKMATDTIMTLQAVLRETESNIAAVATNLKETASTAVAMNARLQEGVTTYSVIVVLYAIIKETASKAIESNAILKEIYSVIVTGRAILQEVVSVAAAGNATLREVVSSTAAGSAVIKMAAGARVALHSVLRDVSSITVAGYAILREVASNAVAESAVIKMAVSARTALRSVFKETPSQTAPTRAVVKMTADITVAEYAHLIDRTIIAVAFQAIFKESGVETIAMHCWLIDLIVPDVDLIAAARPFTLTAEKRVMSLGMSPRPSILNAHERQTALEAQPRPFTLAGDDRP